MIRWGAPGLPAVFLAGAAALMLFAVFAHSYAGALVLMAFVGLTQGGAYTPALLLAMGMNGPAGAVTPSA